MFICNKKLKTIRFFDGNKILKIEWDFYVLYQKIVEKYEPKNNIFIWIYGNWQNIDKECLLVDLNRRIMFYVAWNKWFNHTKLILKYLFVFSVDSLQLIDDWSFESEIFWEIPLIAYERVNLNLKEDFFKYGILYHKKYINNLKLYTVASNFSFAWGHYTTSCYIDTDAMGIDYDQKIAEQNSLSESIERATWSCCLSIEEKVKNLSEENISLLKKYHIDVNVLTLKWNYITSLLSDKKSYFLTENLLYYPVLSPYYYETNSSGMATHLTLKKAIYSALFELIERDAFVYSRLTKSNKVLRLSQDIYSKWKWDLDYSLSFFLLDSFVPIPVVLCMREKDGKTMISLASEITLEKAIEKAYLESFNAIDLFNLSKDQCNLNSPIMKHIFYYLSLENSSKLDWIRNAPLYDEAQDVVEYLSEYEEIIKWFQGADLDLGYFEYKTELNKVFNRNTVRVYSSSLLPIYFWEIIPDYILNHPRMKWKKINRDIHPLG